MHTFLCVSFYFKGEAFLQACKAAGNRVYLLTHSSLKDKPWPREAIDEMFFADDESNEPANMDALVKYVAWLMRDRKVDVIIALDDFDVEKAATMREEFRIPGMGQTTARYYRDKLAMRMRAKAAGIRVPAFTPLYNTEQVHYFTEDIPMPWVLKPRSEAAAAGIKKITSREQLWQYIEALGDRRHTYLLEQFKPGDVYHCDSLSFNGELQFCWVSRYVSTPFDVAHGAGIFRSVTLSPDDEAFKVLTERTADVMKAFQMKHSASHTEFIRSHDDGEFYFLETSARVGGAHLAEMVEAASGVNLWAEWAKIESATAAGGDYHVAPSRNTFAGILISLTRQEYPDTSPFNAPEIVWRMDKRHHVGVIVRSDHPDRIHALLNEYADLVHRDYHASMPVGDKPTA